MNKQSTIRMKAGAVLAAFSLLLTGCFISPGKFESEIVINKDGTFSFTYDGEILFLGLSKLAQMGAKTEEFEAEDCYDDETYEERECSEEELAEQRAEWETGAEERAAKAKEEAQQMAQFLGGIDPTDPQANEELQALLLRHRGWNKVEAMGEGLFVVEYETSGTLTYDMIFPLIEGIPTTNIFVQAILRDDNQVRINAPGFSPESESGATTGMMGGMAGLAAMGGAEAASAGAEGMPTLDGTFTIRTDGEILANNTDEGAVSEGDVKVLTWDISPRTTAEPTALINLGD